MATLVAPLPVTSCISADHMTDAQKQSVSTDLPRLQPHVASARKPKLSLQTASLTGAYGSLSRGIAQNTTQAAFTPTTTNTLTNQWDLSIRPSPISRTESPRPVPPKQQLPYILTLPFGVRSILKNSPLPRQASVSTSPRDSRRRVFFPQPKKVSFRSNLEDAIESQEFVAKHADLSSSEDESSESTPSSSQTNSEDDLTEYRSPPPSRKRKIRRETLTSAETRAKDQDIQSETVKDSGSFKSTHGCKRRRWQWTLPTPTQQTSHDSEPKSDSPVDNDPKTHTNTEHPRDQEDPDLDSCKACSSPGLIPKPDLGRRPDVSTPESEDKGAKATYQEYENS